MEKLIQSLCLEEKSQIWEQWVEEEEEAGHVMPHPDRGWDLSLTHQIPTHSFSVLGRTSPFTSSERKEAVWCKRDFIAMSTTVWAPAFSKRCLHWTWEVSHQPGQTAHTTSFTTRPLFVLVSLQQGAEMPCPAAVFLRWRVQVKLSLPQAPQRGDGEEEVAAGQRAQGAASHPHCLPMWKGVSQIGHSLKLYTAEFRKPLLTRTMAKGKKKTNKTGFYRALWVGTTTRDEDKAQVKHYLPDTHPDPQRTTLCLGQQLCHPFCTLLQKTKWGKTQLKY